MSRRISPWTKTERSYTRGYINGRIIPQDGDLRVSLYKRLKSLACESSSSFYNFCTALKISGLRPLQTPFMPERRMSDVMSVFAGTVYWTAVMFVCTKSYFGQVRR